MKRSTNRIETTHSGSLPRPPRLAELLLARAENRPFDNAELQAEIAASVEQVVALQAKTGITLVNDGEHSKISYSAYLKDRMIGFEGVEQGELSYRMPLQAEAEDFPEFFARQHRHVIRRAVCVGPISWKDLSEVQTDAANLKSAMAKAGIEDGFLGSVAPTTASSFQLNEYYPTLEDYRLALADALNEEYRAIVDSGLVLQVDFPEGVRTRNFPVGTPIEEIRKGTAYNVEMLNHALRGIPADRVRIHVCWGSDPAPHHCDVELRHIVDLLMNINAEAYTLVSANARHEFEWRVWEDFKLPEGKIIIAGVIDSYSNVIEHPQTVADRICRYANVIGRENVIAGVDCGFATISGTENYRVDPRIAWAKLRSLAQGAELATKALWVPAKVPA